MKYPVSALVHRIRRPAGCLLFLLAACTTPEKKQAPVFTESYLRQSREKIQRAETQVQSGDLIFRNGVDEVSAAARSMNRTDTSYSHCGILFRENDRVWVYHALGGKYNPSMKLLREPLDSFCKPEENDAFGIFRYPLDSFSAAFFRHIVLSHYRKGLLFDMYFDFSTDDRMYCSEFVFKSLNQAVRNRLTPLINTDTLPFGVTTDDLFHLPGCIPVSREKFAQ